MSDAAAWTLLVYMAGDNNLSSAGETDLGEMRTVGSSPDVHVVAQFDRAGDRGTARYHIEADGRAEKVQHLDELDSGTPGSLVAFVDWAATNFPAERYGLVLWNHGSGWEPSEIDAMAQRLGTPQFSPREAAERSASPLAKTLFLTSLEHIMRLSNPGDRAICSDDGSGHSLDTLELASALEQIVARLGQPLDLLGMDACLMSNLEVAYQVAAYAAFAVASEESEPNDGWPWGSVVRRLVDDPSAATSAVAAGIADDYLRSYVENPFPAEVTQSALDLSKVAPVAAAAGALGDALLAGMPAAADAIWAAQRASRRFFHNTLCDLADFSARVHDTCPDAAAAMLEALGPGDDRFVVRNNHTGDSLKRVGGVSIYLVAPLVDVSQWYADLAFARDHGWDELLTAYHSA